jgi:dolichol kinase
MIMLAEANYDNQTNRVIFALSMQPLIWGDTFGEVIGSFFGKLEFNVLGIGEVNKKTVEGTISVFISSLAGLYATYYLVLEEGVTMFKYDVHTVFFYTAFLCMIVEVGAPRSTDNFFLQTCGLYIVLNSFNSLDSPTVVA